MRATWSPTRQICCEKIVARPAEQLVILYNSFAVHAYVAMTTALDEVFEQCFRKHGGALGLAARYFKDFVFVPGNKTLERVRECIADPSAGSLQEAFDEFFGHYTSTTAFIWHDAALKVLPQPTSATDWSERDDEFKKQIVVLSGGLNRQALRNLVGFNRETWPMPQQVAEWANRPPEEPAEATE